MSNENIDLVQDTKHMEILGGPKFITLLNSHMLDVLHHNKLFITHLLGVAAQSTNIKSGDISIYYEQGAYDFHAKRRMPIPRIQFNFVTQEGNYINKDLDTLFHDERICHKDYSFKTAQDFQYFMIEQEKSLRSLNAMELILFSDSDFNLVEEYKVSFNVSNIFHYQSKQSEVYQHLLEQNEQLEKFLQFHSLQDKYGLKGYTPVKQTRRKI